MKHWCASDVDGEEKCRDDASTPKHDPATSIVPAPSIASSLASALATVVPDHVSEYGWGGVVSAGVGSLCSDVHVTTHRSRLQEAHSTCVRWLGQLAHIPSPLREGVASTVVRFPASTPHSFTCVRSATCFYPWCCLHCVCVHCDLQASGADVAATVVRAARTRFLCAAAEAQTNPTCPVPRRFVAYDTLAPSPSSPTLC